MVRGVEKRKVQVWIVEGDSCLLLKTRPDRGSFWQPVTGSVDEGETMQAAAKREAIEETGIEFNALPEALGLAFEINNRGVKVFQEVFVYLLQQRPWKIKLDANEHVESQWVTLQTAQAHLMNDSNLKALSALKSFLEK